MLPVCHEGRPIGQLRQEVAGVSFAYEASWLEAPDAFAISVTMPLRPEPYPPETATPWFANLLPEERQLERIGRLLGRSEGDVYGLLEQIGKDAAGALSIGAPEAGTQAGYRRLDEEELAAIIDRLPRRPLLAGEEGVTLSLAGAQTKLPVAIFGDSIHLPLRGAASTHVLKPASDRLYASVENELLCMRLANAIGLEVAPTRMCDAKGRKYLLVERYDRARLGNDRVTRGHQEDFCQALGLYPTEKYEARGGPGLAAIFSTIDRQVRRPARDRLALLDLAIFACCIGDTDRHAKNYALLLTDGGPRLAPGYDLMTSLAYADITRNMAMKIAGKNRAEHLERRHWERFARQVRLAPAASVQRVERLGRAVAEKLETVAMGISNAFPADREALRLFSDKIRERAERVAVNCRRGPPAESGGGDSAAADDDDDPDESDGRPSMR